MLVDTAMSAVGSQWNHDGSILAVAGMMSTGGDKVKHFLINTNLTNMFL